MTTTAHPLAGEPWGAPGGALRGSRSHPAAACFAALLLTASTSLAATGNDAPRVDAFRFADASNRLPARETVSPFLGRPVDGFGPMWLDVDGDHRLDLIFMNHGVPPVLLRNDGSGGFVDRTAGSGIKLSDWDYPQQGDRHGAGCADFGNDGRPDIFIAHGARRGETAGAKRDELLENRGGFRFDDVVEAAGTHNPLGRGRGGVWADFDLDGHIDLYVVNFESPNVLYRNLGDGRFVDASDRIGPELDYNRAAWADYDGDGDPDLLQVWPLKLMRNDGGERFVDATRPAGLRGIGLNVPFALAWRDFDNDGDIDVFVSAKNSPGRLMVNVGGRFRAFDLSLGWAHADDGSTGNGAVWGDVDNDGWPDLLLTRSDGLALFMNQRGKAFSRAPFAARERFELSNGGEAALGDFDGDGYLDAAFNALGLNHLYRNSGGDHSWLALEFRTRTGNRMGFGARVTASAEQADGSTLTIHRQYHGDTGVFRSVGCGPLHLGLGTATTAELTIRWPGGRVQRLSDVALDRWLRLTEPRG